MCRLNTFIVFNVSLEQVVVSACEKSKMNNYFIQGFYIIFIIQCIYDTISTNTPVIIDFLE